MEVRILGGVDVDNGITTAVDVPKERALLAVLALDAGHRVPMHRLVAALWGEDAPPTAEKAVQGHVFRLRRALGAETIATLDDGYALLVEPEAVDAHRFAALVGAGREALDAGEPVRAGEAFSGALALWQGEPLSDLADGEFRSGQRARLDELHLLALEGRLDAELAVGHHDDAVPELERLVSEYPLRERLWGQLMVALYRSARQADALRAYQRLRAMLGEELGIGPSGELRRLESRILRQDPQLDLGAPLPPCNLPAPVSSFVGRVADIERVAVALGEHRLVTLLGPGGVGKTRLALEVGRAVRSRYPEGTWWVDLLSLSDPASVSERVAATLGVRPALTPVTDALVAFLRHREALLLLDNCEHVRPAVADLVRLLLEGAPGVRVAATSRVPLGIAGEQRVLVPPLPVPPAGASPEAFDSVRLFLQRCDERAVRALAEADLDGVAALCRMLDGMPLAIELAAARVRQLSPREIAARLAASVDVLTAAEQPDPRHRSLRATLDWSYALLDPASRRAFDRLTAFPGDFDLGAAEAVAAGPGARASDMLDVMGRLLDASLVEVTANETRRYRLLETMRAYGRSHLSDTEHHQCRQAHTDHFRDLAVHAAEVGPESESADNQAWRDGLAAERHNLLAAVEWSLQNEPHARTLEFARAVGWIEFIVGHLAVGARLLESMLAGSDDAAPVLRAWALNRLMYILLDMADLTGTRRAATQILELVSEADEPDCAGWALWILGILTQIDDGGDVERALPLFERGVALQERTGVGVSKARADVMTCRQLVLADRRDQSIVERLDAAERVLRAAHDPDMSSVDIARLEIAEACDDAEAMQDAARAILRDGETGKRSTEVAYVGFAEVRRAAGDLEGAQREFLRAVQITAERDDFLMLGASLLGLAALAAEAGRPVEAARLWGAATVFSPVWPMFRRRFRPVLAAAETALGDRYEAEVAAGRHLSLDELTALAAFDLYTPAG